MSPDRDVQALIMQAGEIRSESQDLRSAIVDFQNALRRGLFRATVQGVVVVIVAVYVSIWLLGLMAQPWSCDASNLARQPASSAHARVCRVVFPQTGPQVASLKRAAATTAQTLANQQQVINERAAATKALSDLPAKLACVLRILPQNRTDANVNACLK